MSTIAYNKSWTSTLTTPLVINEDDNVVMFTILAVSGDCQIQGTGSFKGVASSAITIPEGQSFTVMASTGSFLDGYTITPAGSTIIDLRQG